MLTAILDALFPPRETERLVRKATPEQLSKRLAPQSISLPGGRSATALLPYRDPLVNALIVEAKFHKNRRAQKLLGALLAEYLSGNRETTLIPIPLSKKRMQSRGENQVECIARETVRMMRGKMRLETHLVNRVRETRPQTELSRHERLENVADAFSAHAVTPNTSYLLIDDVVTTGATLATASTALSAAGATSLTLLALAYSGEK